MFRKIEIKGLNFSVACSWKLLVSSTIKSYSSALSATLINGVPMLPPVNILKPLFSSILEIMVVVVVFPFEPVIAMTGTLINSVANSISLTIFLPSFSAFERKGVLILTPGLIIRTSAHSRKLSE